MALRVDPRTSGLASGVCSRYRDRNVIDSFFLLFPPISQTLAPSFRPANLHTRSATLPSTRRARSHCRPRTRPIRPRPRRPPSHTRRSARAAATRARRAHHTSQMDQATTVCRAHRHRLSGHRAVRMKAWTRRGSHPPARTTREFPPGRGRPHIRRYSL
ncbi:hypothetical protein PLICRDRAFT_471000 [Plicaturopsis crispa FD-325 SS-3]|nr:hypothetical protein PLICRDRAFT_471000 [Plicaturopsis crispa FD-325 SS-3]